MIRSDQQAQEKLDQAKIEAKQVEDELLRRIQELTVVSPVMQDQEVMLSESFI